MDVEWVPAFSLNNNRKNDEAQASPWAHILLRNPSNGTHNHVSGPTGGKPLVPETVANA